MRCIILHGHIFKNAGSSFDWSLSRSFGDGFLDHREDDLMRSDGRAHLEEVVRSNPAVQAISSHNMTGEQPNIHGVKFFPAYILRHPLARIRSVYEFEREQRAQTPGARAASSMTFKDYVAWRMQPDVSRTIRNYQTVYLAGCHVQTSNTEIAALHYNSALARLNSCSLIGVVELYDESMVIMEEALRKFFPEIDLSYVVQNQSRQKRGVHRVSQRQLIAEMLEELGDLQQKVIDENSFDLSLYQTAVLHLQSVVSGMGGFPEKLAEFKRRCQQRQGLGGPLTRC